MADAAAAPGRVHAVRGAVIDVSFPAGSLPVIAEALHIGDSDPPLIAEVQSHLSTDAVRAVALQATAGLRRDALVHPTGMPPPPPWVTPSSAG